MEEKNNSPWLYQLRKHQSNAPARQVAGRLTQDKKTDVAIIGGGIAGIITAYFLLTRTNKNVTLIEAYKIGHGATGHNAGQVTSYFERSFASLVEEFGLSLAGEGQKLVENAWLLLDEVYTNTNASIPFHRFTGHAGLSSREQVEHYIRENTLRSQVGLEVEKLRVVDSAPWITELQNQYGVDSFEIIDRPKLNSLLEVRGETFVAMLSFQKGCINSALLVEHVTAWLIKKFPERIDIFEHTPMSKVVLQDDFVHIDCGLAVVTAFHIILCTNGFDHFSIFNKGDLKLNAHFHGHVNGTIGYMGGFVEPLESEPTAISYFSNPESTNQDPYFYMTRRPFEENEQGIPQNLICIGGPEEELSRSTLYDRALPYPEHAESHINRFVDEVLPINPNRKSRFAWHGLMGYTKNKVRLVGAELSNGRLIYNLGCNGVGILPSIAGAELVSEIIKKGGDMKVTIFSPKSIL